MNIEGKMTAEEVCEEISGELEDAARGLSGGILSAEQFRSLVVELERQKIKRHGYKLLSSISEDQIVHFALRFADTDELCSTMDVDPETGKLVAHHHGCK